MAKYCMLLSLSLALCLSSLTLAAPPSETLLPETTKGFLSVPNVEELREHWNATQLGHLVQDPVMKPFAEDLRDQIKSKLSATRVRLGLTLDDLQGIYGGELCLAAMQPDNDINQQATVLLVDVTGHTKQVQEAIDKARKNLLAQGARPSDRRRWEASRSRSSPCPRSGKTFLRSKPAW